MNRTLAVSARRSVRVRFWVELLVVSLLALAPRLANLADFYTTDEAYFWQGRVARFAAAISMQDWAATNQTGHPGVTTMWLGTLGSWLAIQWAVLPGSSGAAYLAFLRLPLALANGLAVVLGFLLLRRLLPHGTAWLAALLWAASPFLVAHSRLLHLDGLLTTLMTLSLLLLLVATRHHADDAVPRSSWQAWGWLAASGAAAGLALLTKAPGLLLLPFAALVMCINIVQSSSLSIQHLQSKIQTLFLRYLLWLAAAVAVVLVAWPALWVSPGQALGAVLNEISGNGAQPHASGNYFLGQPTADPGPLFYLTVVSWRGDPLLLLGLCGLLLAGASLLYRAVGAPGQALSLLLGSQQRRVALVLLTYSLGFTAALTLLAKKFDRYLLPIWPALAVLAALGLVALARRLNHMVRRRTRLEPFWARLLPMRSLLVVVLLVAPLLRVQPYYLAYYNPLLGGGLTAQQVLLSGWGEGMDKVGLWLSQRPDLARGPVLSWLPPTLQPFLPVGISVYDLDLAQMNRGANYAVIYTGVARRDQRTVAEAYAAQTPPLATIRIFGITYATIHQLPRPYTTDIGADFNFTLHLRGISQELRDQTLVITPSWDVRADQPGGVTSFYHVLNEQNERVGQLDVPLDGGLFATWQQGQQFGESLPIALPPELPAGTYRVTMGLYTPGDGQRLPVTRGQPLPAEVNGLEVIEIARFTVEPR